MVDMFLTNVQLFTSQNVTWSHVDFFRLSFWQHPFTADSLDLLVSKWCNATFLQICSVKKTLLYIYSKGEYILHKF